METVKSIAELKNAIQILEFEQTFKEQQLKEQLQITYESLKPVNLIRSALQEVTSLPYLTDNILGATVGLASGYLTKKIAVGRSGNIIRKLFGIMLQFGVTNLVAQNPETIKSIGRSIYKYLVHKKEINQENS